MEGLLPQCKSTISTKSSSSDIDYEDKNENLPLSTYVCQLIYVIYICFELE